MTIDDFRDIDEEELLKDAEFINPPNTLKQKAGNGGIPIQLIEQGETFIHENDIDFVPFARDHLKEIKNHLAELKKAKNDKARKKALDPIVQNIMLIKAHGGMFNYHVMSAVADVALKFLDGVEKYNEDLYQIIEAHNNSINVVIQAQMKGAVSTKSAALVDELREATQRFQKKYG